MKTVVELLALGPRVQTLPGKRIKTIYRMSRDEALARDPRRGVSQSPERGISSAMLAYRPFIGIASV